ADVDAVPCGRPSLARKPSLLVAQRTQRLTVVGPALAHLHPQLQENLAAEEPLHLVPRIPADALEQLAALADDDRLLPRPLDPDDRRYPRQPLFHLQRFDLHRDGIRQLLTQGPHQLLADQLGGTETVTAVGDLLLREQLWRFRQQLDESGLELGQVGPA